MLQIICLMKSKESFNRIKLSIDNVEWEDYIGALEQLQEKMVLSDYDMCILDDKLWWKEEAESLLNKKGIEIIEFNGNFEDIISSIQERIPEIEEEISQENNTENTVKKPEPEIKYIVQEVEVEKVVEKVVVKSRNIKQEIISILSTDDLNMRDSFSCNVAAIVTGDEDTRTLLIDITNFNNLINHLEIETYNKCSFFEIKNLNPNTIQSAVSKVKGYKHLDLLSIDNTALTKKNIKSILFAARDYDNILFVTESNLNNIVNRFILNISHRVFIITEPLMLLVKNNLDIIKSLLENGQISTNIKILVTGIEPMDIDSIEYMYRGYEVGFLSRQLHLNAINKKKFISNKKEINNYKSILNIEKAKKKLFFFSK